jgi:hypothetical protein
MLREAMASFSDEVTAKSRQAFEEWLSANELGLAFDELVGALIEQAIAVSTTDLERLEALAERFELSDRAWRAGLIVTST